MNQIMRLRRIAGSDHGINDHNNGHRHEKAFVKHHREEGHAATRPSCCRDSYGGDSWFGKLTPPARRSELIGSLPTAIRGAAAPARCTITGALRSHHKLPSADLDARQADLRHRRGPRRARRAEPLHHRRRTRTNAETPAEPTAVGAATRRGRDERDMKVAYWPGCVSRGFTPELHGSMALVAAAARHRARRARPRQLLRRRRHRRAQPGARRHAERAHLRARPADRGAELMMNICSTCQGAQSECQERLDANAEYRAHVNETLGRRGPRVRRRASPTRTSSGCWSRTSASTSCRSQVKRPLTDLRVGPFYGCYIVRPTDRLGITPSTRATRTSSRSSRRSAARSSTTPAATSAAASRSSR